MSWQFSFLALFSLLTTILTFGLGVLGWSKRHQPGSAFFALLMFAASAWSLAVALGSAAVTPRAKIFFGILEYPGVVSIPVLWFLFAADYTRRDRWLTRRRQLLLWIIPALTLVLAFTNERHRLLWSDIVPGDTPDVFVYQRGPYFWVHLCYSYAWFVAGTALLFFTIRQTKGMYRRQSLAIALAALIPWLGNLIYILDLSPLHGFDVTPLAFAIAGIIFTWNVLRFRFLDLMPIARDFVIESMTSGVLVLDAHDRLVDMNHAARQALDLRAPPAGAPCDEMLAHEPALLQFLRNHSEPYCETQLGAPPRDFEIRVSALRDQRAHPVGRVIVLRDITERKTAERVLRESEERYRELFATAPFPIVITGMEDNTILYANQRMTDLFNLAPEQAIGKPAPDFWRNPCERDLVLAQLAQHQFVRDHPVELRLPTGETFPALLSASVTQFQNQRAIFASIADLTEQKKSEQAERDAREFAEALRDTAAALTSSLAVDQVVERILANLARVTAYDFANIMFIEGAVARIVHARQSSGDALDAALYANIQRPVAQVAGFRAMIETHQALVVPNVAAAPDWAHYPESAWIKSYAGAPLIVNDQVIGFLNLDSRTPGFYTASHAARIRAFADQAALAIQNARLFEETQRLATIDPLTGLFNRRHFTDLALLEIERAHRYHRPLSLILLDIDHFKQVNDTLGHLAGDRVLQTLAERCRTNLRRADLIGRHGGEEFVILLPETPLTDATRTGIHAQSILTRTDAYAVAERLRQQIQATQFETPRGAIAVTISLGVAQLDPLPDATTRPSQLDELETLIAHADRALYRAKAHGRNQVAVYAEGS